MGGRWNGGWASRLRMSDVTPVIPLLEAVPPVRGKRGRRHILPSGPGSRGESAIARRGTGHGSGPGVQRRVVERACAHLHCFPAGELRISAGTAQRAPARAGADGVDPDTVQGWRSGRRPLANVRAGGCWSCGGGFRRWARTRARCCGWTRRWTRTGSSRPGSKPARTGRTAAVLRRGPQPARRGLWQAWRGPGRVRRAPGRPPLGVREQP